MKTSIVVLITGLLITSKVSAQTSAAWLYNGQVTPSATGANITAGNTTLGSAIVTGAFNGPDYFGEGGWPSGSIDLNAYIQVTLGPNSGYYLVLNSITMNLRRSTTGSGSGPNSWSLRSSLDGYTATLTSGTLTTSYQAITFALPAAFQTITGPVSFRIYGYNQVTTAGGGLNRFVTNGISIKGQSIAGTLAAQSIGLTAKAATKAIDLQWQTEGFTDGTELTLQRSFNGADFSNIMSLTGSSAVDNNVQPGELFYRIVAQSPDGSIYFSPVVAVTMPGNRAGGQAIRGIATEGTTVRALLHLPDAGSYQLSIRSIDGKALYNELVNVQAGDATNDIAFGARPHGIYILTLAGQGTIASGEFRY
jgi:hypothetical protein